MHTVNFPLGIVIILVKHVSIFSILHSLSPADPRQLFPLKGCEFLKLNLVLQKVLNLVKS